MTIQDGLNWISGGWKSDIHARTINGALGIDTDGLYGFQCKDFVNGYANFMGAPFTAGNAITLWTVAQAGWDKVDAPQPGDVFVKDYVAADGANYGHTGCVVSVTSTGVNTVDQNWFNTSLTVGSPPATVFHPFGTIKGYLRRQGMSASALDIGKAMYHAVLHREPESDAAAIGAGNALLADASEALEGMKTSAEWKDDDMNMTAAPGLRSQVATLSAQVTDKNAVVTNQQKQIDDLEAQLAVQGSDTVQLNALGSALQWLVKRLGLVKQ